MPEHYDTFDQYWLAYLNAHSKASTRAWHYFGTTLGVVGGLCTAWAVAWWAAAVVGFVGYGLALLSHPLVQGNKPFARRPVWGIISDFRMLWLASTGALGPHLERLRENAA